MPSVSTFLLPLYLVAGLLAGSGDLGLVHAQLTSEPNTNVCVSDCESINPSQSTCNGDETGKALEKCSCDRFMANNDPLILCVQQQCSWDEQLAFARDLPGLCARTLFPWFDLSTTTPPPVENTAAAASDPSRPTTATSIESTASTMVSSSSVVHSGKNAGASSVASNARTTVLEYLLVVSLVGVAMFISNCQGRK